MLITHKSSEALAPVFTVSSSSWKKGQGEEVEFYRGEEGGF